MTNINSSNLRIFESILILFNIIFHKLSKVIEKILLRHIERLFHGCNVLRLESNSFLTSKLRKARDFMHEKIFSI